MPLTNLDKAPFPWFGGKRRAAPLIWERLGDVGHYVEPFAGSLAVLLCRPHMCNRAYHSETVNDMDGLLVNAWRAIQWSPDETADAASWPVAEADLHARHSALVRWRHSEAMAHLCGDPAWHDPVMAGWWIWGQSCWIGGGWSSGVGPWVVDDRGCLVRQPGTGQGVWRQLPHLGNNGRGVNHAGAREPGVERRRPHLGNNGQGVNHAGAREPGTGQGVWRQLPHLRDNGQGVNHAGAREPGVDDGEEYHPMTMPEIRRWFRFLSARLRHVRILNGDWKRLTTNGATKTLSVDAAAPCGVLLDPPYSGEVRDSAIYSSEDLTVAAEARQWCLDHGGDPLYRIALCGFEGEGHELLTSAGWSEEEWYVSGFLRGGMGNIGGSSQQRRERIWFSPHCLRPADTAQLDLWGES